MSSRFKTNAGRLKNDRSKFESGGGSNWMRLVDGKNIIRILPPWSEAGDFYQKVGFHREPGKLSGKKVVCPDFTFGKECAICKRRGKVFKALGKDGAKNFNPQKRAYLNVLDMKKADGEVYVLEVGPQILNEILKHMFQGGDSEDDFSDQLLDPENGFNINLTRKKEGGFTKYDVFVKSNPYSLSKNGYDVDEIMEGLHDLGAMVKMPDPDDVTDVLDILNEASSGDDNGDDDDGEPRKRRAPKDDDDDTDERPAKKRPRDEDDEEEERPAKKKPRSFDDDEEDEAPAKKSKRVESDDDEEEERPAKKPKRSDPDDEDEDEEPAPKKKAKPADDDEEEEEARPAKKKPKPADDDEDDEPKAKRKRGGDDDFDDLNPGGKDEDDTDDIPF